MTKANKVREKTLGARALLHAYCQLPDPPPPDLEAEQLEQLQKTVDAIEQHLRSLTKEFLYPEQVKEAVVYEMGSLLYRYRTHRLKYGVAKSIVDTAAERILK